MNITYIWAKRYNKVYFLQLLIASFFPHLLVFLRIPFFQSWYTFHLVKATSLFSWRFLSWNFPSSCSSLVCLVLGPVVGSSFTPPLPLCCVRSPVSPFPCLPFSCFFLFCFDEAHPAVAFCERVYRSSEFFKAYVVRMKYLYSTVTLDWHFGNNFPLLFWKTCDITL